MDRLVELAVLLFLFSVGVPNVSGVRIGGYITPVSTFCRSSVTTPPKSDEKPRAELGESNFWQSKCLDSWSSTGLKGRETWA